ncbi:uncharacterized protein LOC120348145 [Styela clava]
MKEIVLVILYAFLENCASKGWKHKRLPDIQGNVTYNDFSITDLHKNNPTHVGHVLFIYITNVSMHITADTTCTAELKLPKMESICLTPEVRCIFYQPTSTMWQISMASNATNTRGSFYQNCHCLLSK